MPNEFNLDVLAAEVKAAQDGARPIVPITDRFPDFDIESAYRVARRIHEARLAGGARPVGRKIGFTNPAMWERFGVRQPIWAFMYDSTVVQLAEAQAHCALGAFVEPRIEPEIVLGFGAAPAASGNASDVLAAVEWVAHGFEVVQSHCPGWRFEAPDTVADWALHGTLLIGPRVPLAQLGENPASDLESFRLDLTRNGTPVESGTGANVLGSPLAAVVHLLGVLAGQRGVMPLQAGEIVTTGTITTAHSVNPGETWRTAVHGIALPGLAVTFVE